MRAVVYHANAHFAWGGDVGDLYERLFKRYVEMCHRYGMEVIHLTLDGHPGWGDVNIYYPQLSPANIMFNREECFTQFLESAAEDDYWFCEPDYEITKMWPKLTSDCALLYRHGDDVPVCPAWRMATPKALPLFRRVRDTFKGLKPVGTHPEKGYIGFDWHGDSWAFTQVWKDMGKPKGVGLVKYLGLEIEFRNYADYIKPLGTYGRNYFGRDKKRLLGETS